MDAFFKSAPMQELLFAATRE